MPPLDTVTNCQVYVPPTLHFDLQCWVFSWINPVFRGLRKWFHLTLCCDGIIRLRPFDLASSLSSSHIFIHSGEGCGSVVKHLSCMQKVLKSISDISGSGWERFYIWNPQELLSFNSDNTELGGLMVWFRIWQSCMFLCLISCFYSWARYFLKDAGGTEV